jgi:hypothetical protein
MTGKPGRPKKNHKKKKLSTWIRQESYAYICETFADLESLGASVDELVRLHRKFLAQKIAPNLDS